MIRLIAAVSSNGVIGRGGGMPWKRIAEDRDWLLSQIRGGVVVLGRRSFEETNRPLPGVKATVVVTRNPARVPTTTAAVAGDSSPGGGDEGPVVAAGSLAAALDEASRLSESEEGGHGGNRATTWICGGEAIYEEAMLLRRAELLYLTRVHAWCDGDTRFPSCHRSFFPETLWAHDGADANYRYTFAVLGRGRDSSSSTLVARHPPANWK